MRELGAWKVGQRLSYLAMAGLMSFHSYVYDHFLELTTKVSLQLSRMQSGTITPPIKGEQGDRGRSAGAVLRAEDESP